MSTADGDAPPVLGRSVGGIRARLSSRRLEERAEQALAQQRLGEAEGLLAQALISLGGSAAVSPRAARLARRLGALEVTLGRFEPAEAHLRQALGNLEQSPSVSPDNASCLELLASAQRENGQIEEALRSSRRALDMRRQLAGAPIEVAQALTRAGLSELGCGDVDAAIVLFGQALDIARAAPAASSVAAACLRNLAGAYLRRGNLDLALANAQDAVALSTESGASAATTAECVTMVGDVQMATGQAVAALRSFLRALEITEAESPRSLVMVSRLVNVGDAHRLGGELRPALARYTEALALALSVAPQSRQVARCLNNAGYVRRQLGELDEALTYFTRALEIEPSMAEAMSNIGSVHLDRGDAGVAGVHYERALEIEERSRPPRPASTARDLCYLAVVRLTVPGAGSAAELVARAVQLVDDVRDPRARAGVLCQLAEVETSLGRDDVAAGHLQQALALDRNALPGSLEVARELALLGKRELRAGDLGAALGHLHEAVDIESRAGARSRAAARHLRQLGAVAEATGDSALARQCGMEAGAVEEALDRQGGVPGPGTPADLLADAGVNTAPVRWSVKQAMLASNRWMRLTWFGAVAGSAVVFVWNILGPWWTVAHPGLPEHKASLSSLLGSTVNAAPLIAVAAIVLVATGGASMRRPWAGRRRTSTRWAVASVILLVNAGLLVNFVTSMGVAASPPGATPTGDAYAALAGAVVAALGGVVGYWLRLGPRRGRPD